MLDKILSHTQYHFRIIEKRNDIENTLAIDCKNAGVYKGIYNSNNVHVLHRHQFSIDRILKYFENFLSIFKKYNAYIICQTKLSL